MIMKVRNVISNISEYLSKQNENEKLYFMKYLYKQNDNEKLYFMKY